MKREQLRVGKKVKDYLDGYWQTGVIKEILKTRVKIQYHGKLMTYDNAHLQFLKKG